MCVAAPNGGTKYMPAAGAIHESRMYCPPQTSDSTDRVEQLNFYDDPPPPPPPCDFRLARSD